MTTKMPSSRDFQILLGILLLALGLRLWGLNAPLWYDEILTLETHIRLPWDEMMQTYSMNHHYLYSIQAKLSVAIFGESAWAIRLPAMIFGVASIGAVWCLAKQIAGRNIAHITALLLAVSFHHIWFSQNARGYSELAFWSTTGMVLFLRGLKMPSIKVWLGYAACLSLAVATHLTGVFFFFAQGLVWLVIAVANIRTLGVRAPVIAMPAIAFLAGGLAALLFYTPIISDVLQVANTVSETSSVDVMKEYQSPLWSVLEAVRTTIGSLGPLVGIVAAITIALVILGGRTIWSDGKLFPIVVLLHIVLTMVLLTALGMRIWPRFFFVDIGFLMLLIVLGVGYAVRLFSDVVEAVPHKALYTAAIAAMIVISCGLASRNYSAPKQNLAGAYEYVEATRMANDRIFAVGTGADIFGGHFAADWGVIGSDEQLSEALARPGSVHLVVIFPARHFRAIPLMDQLVEDGEIEVSKRFSGTLGDGNVLVLRRP